MRIKALRPVIEQEIMRERERCARVCERMAETLEGDGFARPYGSFTPAHLRAAAEEIRSANPPSIKVRRPETIAKNPELAVSAIIAGQSHETNIQPAAKTGRIGLVSCVGNDPLCPCRDGDLCHYRGKDAWPVSGVA